MRSAWLVALLAAIACSDGAPPPLSFPASFRFGFATVAYQSEGTMRADGTRVSSNWSEWEDLGKLDDGQHNDHGNGFFDHYTDDLDRASSLGADSFSYAIDWSRLEPSPGVFDEQELARVVSIVQAMRARNLRPLIVLFHWVTPSWVQSPVTGIDLLAGTDHSFVDAFLPLVQKVVPALAPYVDDWVTFEEPYSIVLGEYLSGQHPPGHVLDVTSSAYAIWNLMYLNARTYKLVHQLDTADADGDGVTASVGMENLAVKIVPLDSSSTDDQRVAAHFDYIMNQSFLNGVIHGDIDVDMDGKVDNPATSPPEGNDPELANTLDFIGLNYYQVVRARAGGALGDVAPFFGTPLEDVRYYDPSAPHSDLYQEISSSGLRDMIEEYAQYKLPMVVSETGLADQDDDQRPYYLLDHLYTTARAIADGFDVRGFYCWTISDNFEWWEGTTAHFGVFSVDFTQPSFPRTRLRSADAYSDIAHARAVTHDIWTKWALPAYPVGVP